VTQILHIGDLHIVARRRSRANTRVQRIVAWILAHYTDPETHLVFTGDIVESGTENEHTRAIELLHPLAQRYKMLIAPGNHDVGPIGNIFASSAQNNSQRHMVGQLMQSFTPT